MLSMIFLSDVERDQLRAQHRRERDGRVRDRIKAVLLYVKDIIAYVQSTWSVTYSVPGMRNWLQRYGFSYKKSF